MNNCKNNYKNNYINSKIEYTKVASCKSLEERHAQEEQAWHALDIDAQLQTLRNRIIVRPLTLYADALPEAEKVAREVKVQLSDLAKARGNAETLLIGAWNMLYLDAFKAKYFIDTYREVLACHHLLAVEEVNLQALSIIGRACGYGYFTSSANSRGQAVGYLLHPRLEVVRRIEYPQITGIYGIPDLRPALQLDLCDGLSGKRFTAIVVHLKSMRGGEKITGLVRYKQLQKLVEIIGETEEPTLVLGDFNCHLDNTRNTIPLTNSGYSLLDAEDETSTQSMGGRLDGMFHKNLFPTARLSGYSVHNFWSNQIIGNTLSDHALLTWKMDFARRISKLGGDRQRGENHAYLAQVA